MTHSLSVAHLTAIGLAPPEFIHAAAHAGFDGVGLRLLRVTETSPGYPLHEDAQMLRATREALAATGLEVGDIEFLKLTPDTRPEDYLPLLEAGAALGARHLITAPYDPDLARLAARLNALGELAAPLGIKIMLEFFPWTSVPDLGTALHVVEAAGPATGLLVDSLHFDRSGSDPAELQRIDPDRLPFAHLCDAPVLPSYSTEELLRTAREDRCAPGEGQIDLARFLRALPAGIPLTLEVPMQALEEAEGSQAVLTHVAEQTRNWLARHGF